MYSITALTVIPAAGRALVLLSFKNLSVFSFFACCRSFGVNFLPKVSCCVPTS